jgi:predicted CXXCH cytochrome family protein
VRIAFLITYLLSCGTSVDPKSPEPQIIPDGAYVGSQVCASCHAEAFEAWAGSHHHLAEQGAQIGVDPLRQNLVDVGTGRFQVSQEAWDVVKMEHFDVFADGRQPGEWGHWTGRGMTWNTMCAECHNTGLTKGYSPSTDSFDTQRAEQGVGCEACHGKGSRHVADTEVSLVTPDLDTCGTCHSRRASLTEAFQPGDAYLDHYAPSLPDLSDVYWADGQVRDEDFEYVSFLSSGMYAAGVTCIDCHDAHTGKVKRQGDALCLECHETQEAFEVHDPHGGAVTCVQCHMPVTVYMQRDPRHDHGFSSPDPVLTASLGIPNACDRCHEGTAPPPWAAPENRPQRRRTVALDLARRGDPSGLLTQARTDPSPFWRAVAAGGLGPWASDPEVAHVLGALAQHSDPWVRYAAAGSHVEPVALEDDLRAVRIQSQRALMGQRRPTDRGMVDLRAYLELNRDQPSSAVELGNWWLVSGSPAAGVAEIRRAIRLDPGSGAHRASLARALAQVGRVEEAAQELQHAVEQHSDDVDLHYLLALALSDLGQLDASIRTLERVVFLDPSRARAWFNLGLARQRQKDLPGAVQALQEALALNPQDSDAAAALAALKGR